MVSESKVECQAGLGESGGGHGAMGLVLRRRRATASKAFAGFAAVAMVLVVFAPLSEAAAATAPTGTPGPPGDGGESTGIAAEAFSATSPRMDPRTDSPGGLPPLPGTVTSVPTPPSSVVSWLPGRSAAPILDDLPDEYRYTTVAGTYAFPKASPFVVRYESSEGGVLVRASTFVVADTDAVPFVSPKVVNVTLRQFQARYELLRNGSLAGVVTVTYDFRWDAPPKITGELQGADASKLALTWVILTVDTVVANETTLADFTSVSGREPIGSSGFRLTVGPDADRDTWDRELTVDWTDAGVGRAYVGEFSAPGLDGRALLVEFPAGMSVVDPQIVGTSSKAGATDFTIQRKAFTYANRIWAFWDDGTGIVYANSANGSSWSLPVLLNTAPYASSLGFDVDARDGIVIVGYVQSDLRALQVMTGSIDGGAITWGSGPAGTWSLAEAGPPTIAIGTDGYFWAVVPHPGASGVAKLYVYRSMTAGSGSFDPTPSLEIGLGGTSSDSVGRILAASKGQAQLIRATTGDSYVRRYFFSSGGWSGFDQWPLDQDRARKPHEMMSAVALWDDRVRIVYRHTSGALYAYTIPFSGFEISEQVATGPIYYPSISLDLNGDSHVFYRNDSGSQYRIDYVRTRPLNDSWTTPEEPIAYSGAKRVSLSAFLSSSNIVGLLWTEGSNSPYTVRFGGVSPPMDLGTQTGQPWSRQGISAYGSYFRQLGEFVSPGSGLLTIKQTDLVLPGRGLNLEVARVFVTPRAFSIATSTPSPYLYEEYPWANLGKGWRLNFPWLSDQYLHLWDGQMYVVSWKGNAFENHEGEPFLLTRQCAAACDAYTLYATNGVRFEFNGAKQLTTTRDPNGNVVSLFYASNRLDRIVDSLGRIVSFAYNPNGTLASIGSESRTVRFLYQDVGGTRLRSVTDPAGRTTYFDHADAQNPYLLTSIRYPTGGRTAFTWGSSVVQVDLRGYHVTLQDARNATDASVRSSRFTYTAVNGRVSYANVESLEAGGVEGNTVLLFDARASQSVSSRYPAGGTRLARETLWFGASGSVEQVDVYTGASGTPSQSVRFAHDDWGNRIYSRDGIGHERFASFMNTSREGGFYVPGRLVRSTSGLVFHDDFESRDLNPWPQTGSVLLEYPVYDTVPPTMNVTATPSAAIATAAHTFPAQSGTFWFETAVRPEETTRDHLVRLKTGSILRLELRFQGVGAGLAKLQRNCGTSCWTDLQTYAARQWYRITIEAVVGQGTGWATVYVDGAMLNSAAMLNAGPIDTIEYSVTSCPSCPTATLYVDRVEAWGSMTLTVTGLAWRQLVQYVDGFGRSLGAWRAPDGGGPLAITLPAGPDAFPYGTLLIFGTDGGLEFSSPTHEFWGGETWAYTRPWTSASLTLQRSGFLRATTGGVYVDDSLPIGSVLENRTDYWNWGAYGFPPYGAQSHLSPYQMGTHEHAFRDATTTLAMSAGQYHIQYVYLTYPDEVMLEFRDTTDSWEHRAFWGVDAISRGTNGTASRQWMGSLPSQGGRWVMLVAKADDVGTAGRSAEGLGYVLHGGQAAWDFSARGDSETGEIRVAQLQPTWKAELYDTEGNFVAAATVPGGGTIAAINVYDAPRKIRAFPFEGYLLVRNASGAAVYRGPATSFWGGDVYDYAATNFYSNPAMEANVHDRLAASLEYQTGRGASPEVPQDVYVRYDAKARPDLVKVRERRTDGSAVWWSTTYAYDPTYGVLTSVTDPSASTVTYSNSPTYSRAHVTQVSDALGILARYAYDNETGWLSSTIDGRGYVTRIGHDVLGRQVSRARFNQSALSEILYLDMEWTTEEAAPRMQDLSGRGHHGTITGTMAVPGAVGRARDFQGASDILVADAAPLDLGPVFTLAASVKPDTVGGEPKTILRKTDVLPMRGYLLRISPSDASLTVEVWDNGAVSAYQAPANVLSAGTWHHVAFTFASGAGQFYVNGLSVPTTRTGDLGVIAPSATSNPLHVGSADGVAEFMDGTLDEVRIFNAVLAASDILALRTGTYRVLSSGTLAYDDVMNVLTAYEPTTRPRLVHLDMESLLGGRLEDLAGRGSHGTLVGTTAVTGRVGGARAFDGNDHVSLGDVADFEGRSPFSVSAWVRRDADVADWMRIVSKEALTPTREGWLLFVHAVGSGQDNKLGFERIRGGTISSVRSTTVTAVGTWYYVTVTYDGGTLRMYVNGSLEDAQESTSGLLGHGYPLRIGAESQTAASPFRGAVDEVQAFDHALGATEAAQIATGSEKGHYEKGYFDVLGRATRSVRRDLFGTLVSWESFAYDFGDRIVERVLARNATTTFTTRYTYDFLGRPTSVNYPDVAETAYVTYDDVNRIRTVDMENGRRTAYAYDLTGRTTQVREYYGPSDYHATAYEYDEAGNLLTATNALGQVTRHEYDGLNRLVKTTYPDVTKTESYWYDAVGQVATRTDRAGQATSYGYDARHRLATVLYPDATPDVTYVYDGNDNVLWANTSGVWLSWSYDGLDRVVSETTQFGGTSYYVGYAYDAAGRVTSLTYPHDADLVRRGVSYTYDAVGRPSEVRYASTTVATIAYNADDLLKDAALGNGVVESASYDVRGRPTRLKATYGTTTYLDLGYAYDGSGNVLGMGSAAYTYDALDRLVTATGGFGSHTYAYDAAGNRKTLEYGGGFSGDVVLRPNGAGALTQWSRSGCTANYLCVDEGNPPDNDATRVSESTNGETDLYAIQDLTQVGAIESVTVTAVARGVYAKSCGPECVGYLRLRVHGFASDVKGVGFEAYEAVSKTWWTNPATGVNWTLEDVNALQAGVEKLTGYHGALSVRVTQVYVTVRVRNAVIYTYADGPTGMNELSYLMRNDGTNVAFTYDAKGNLLTRTGGGASWNYSWNAENLMTWAALGGARQQRYVYDGLGRRGKVEGTTAATWTVSIVSGADVIFERTNAGATTKYVYASGLRIARIDCSGVPASCTTSYYLGDHEGSTRKVLDSSRTTVFSTEYEPFGKPVAPSGAEAYKYTSEKHDDPTGLVYLRARQYDPEIGRFVSADPVLGSLSRPQTQNRYAYVANNPLIYTDPTGKIANLIAAGIGAAIGAAVGYFGCVYVTGGWTSSDCAIAAGAGAAVGALAGLTFGASLALAGTAGLGTATASGGFAFAGASGLAAFTFAGAVSGAVAGAAEYLLSGGIALAQGQEWQFSGQEFVENVGWGIVGGAAGGAGGYVLGAAGSRLYHGGLRSFGARWTPGGKVHAGNHLNELAGKVSPGKWFKGAERIARSSFSVVTENPGGGFRAYGTISGYPVRVPVKAAGIVTAFVDTGGIPWSFWREGLGIAGSVAGAGWWG